RQIVSDAAFDSPVLVLAGELVGVRARLRVRRAVGITFERDRRYCDRWVFREPSFQIVIFRLALRETEPPAVIVADNGDVIGIFESRRAAIKGRVVEVPLRRGNLPDQLREIAPIFVVADTAALRREVILIPPLQLGRRW